MPKVVVIAEQHLVFTREIEVTDEELAQMQATLAAGGQQETHLLAEGYLSDEHIQEDSGFEAVRLEIVGAPPQSRPVRFN